MSDALPHGWTTTSLGELCDDRVMQGPPTTQPVQYIDISAIDRSTKRVGETTLVTGSDAPTRARQWVRTDDVLVSMTRPNLNAVALVGPELDGTVASTGFDVLRPRVVEPKWIFYRVRTNGFVADVCEGLQGVVYPAIRPHDVRRHELPLPPLPEQHRIVAAIESYFTRLDDAVATLERVQRNLKRYRASVLKAAVEGRLVPTEAELARAEGRSYEPASVLLTRILAERRRRWEEAELAKMTAKGQAPKDDKWKAKYVEPVAPDTSELPELPEGWEWVCADAVCSEIVSGSTPVASELFSSAGEIPFIKVYNLTMTGELDFTVKPTFISKAIHNGQLARSRVCPGDVLTNIVGPPLGKVSVVPREYDEWNINQAITAFRPSGGIYTEWLCLVLMSEPIQRWLLGTSKTTTSQVNLAVSACRRVPLPLPPLREQERIAAEAERLLSMAAEAGVDARRNVLRVRRLRQSILKWAFEGRLVDQDPTDEPASVLLERIRAERKSTGDETARSPRRARVRRNARA
ncbi:MAG: restriction endonuclease subunit S [Acidobacteria bacterium]|jgi:type I restriction enzyme S subunit|nr:restriction endonuclease subunit S [Acidobacteriota bacterium]